MESKYRYRLLIYFAALVLCLSICFANAEEIHPAAALQTATSEQFVFQGSQTHATFMPALHLAFVYEATAAATDAPVVSQSMLQQVTTDTQKSHRFWHGASFAKRKPALIVNHSQIAPMANEAVQGQASETSSASQTE